ncbi:M48 family metallopeptidase [Aliidiomarina sp. Khilg15.8]
MNYTISRSQRRRTIGITIKQGKVRVLAPTGLANHRIEDFVASKQQWIQGHLQAQQAQLAPLPARRWEHGEYLYWLGQKLQLQVRAGQRNTIVRDENDLLIRISRRTQDVPKTVKKLVTDWFKTEGQRWLDAHVQRLSAFAYKPAASWRVANYHAKWGACNQRGELSFSWRLFSAPDWVVRYVVVHELCHLTHFNHSPAYWELVERFAPDYRAAEQWLKVHGHTLLNEDYFNFVNEK